MEVVDSSFPPHVQTLSRDIPAPNSFPGAEPPNKTTPLPHTICFPYHHVQQTEVMEIKSVCWLDAAFLKYILSLQLKKWD